MQTIKSGKIRKMYSIYKTNTAKEREFLVLSYMCLNDWKMTAQNVDQKKNWFFEEKICLYIRGQGQNIVKALLVIFCWVSKTTYYKFDLNIMKKIVFVRAAKKSTNYFKHVIKTVSWDMDTWYTECFTEFRKCTLIYQVKKH